jgi:signal transduction histidine kinase/predicted RNA-binding protein with RPS1 domain
MEERKTITTYHPRQRVTATVEQIFSFGAFVRLPDGTEAYVRRRELSHDSTLLPRDVVSVGQQIPAIVVALPEGDRKLELSLRQAEPDPWTAFVHATRVRDTVTATVKNLSPQGVWVQIVPGVDGFVPRSELAPWPVQEPGDLLWVGDQVEAMITGLDGPARRVRLSIRRQMIHQAQVHEITEQLRAGELSPVPDEPLPEAEDLEAAPAEPIDLQGLGPVLIVDDDAGVRDGLVAWLQRHGCRAEGVGRSEDGLARAQQVPYGLVIVDLDLAGRDGLGLIRTLQRVQPDTPVAVISIPEWIAERSQDLEEAGVADVFGKPLNLDEVADTLARLARGETIGPIRLRSPRAAQEKDSTFQRLAQTMRSGNPLEARLETALAELVRGARADLGALFHLDPISQQVDVVARAGQAAIRQEAVYGLAQSPVKDLILDGGEEFETHLSPQVARRFEKLLNAVDFESCLGVPVPAQGRMEHALFLFHREPDAFSRYRLRDAQATATLLGVALESQALEERIQAVNPFLVSGQLAAGFGHDVFNKMTGLELQVRNVRAACRAGAAPPGGLPSCEQVAQDLDRLLETTLDLKKTVDAFQALIRAEGYAAMDVNQVVGRSVLLLQSTAQRARVHVEVDARPDLPPVVGSPVRLQQAFLNVMLNAIQHVAPKRVRWPRGKSQLRIVTGLEPGRGREVWVRFVDTGPGIHRQLWERIFALGFSTRLGGSGLGLFIARSLVESMGGQIAVEQSSLPAGTTFLVELPAARADPE